MGSMTRGKHNLGSRAQGLKLPEDENYHCINCERLKWKLMDAEKNITELKKENRELLEENAILRYLRDGTARKGG
jgi:hypothetical protein